MSLPDHRLLDFSSPRIMGVLNVTPDSFSDGGRYDRCDVAVLHALQMIEEGADIVDIGGESTRPGAAPVEVNEELQRVIPVIKAIRRHSDIPISIDTSKAEVMRQAVNAGASMINDVLALQGEGALETVAQLAVPVCLMHMQGEPRSMQQAPHYDDVVSEVLEFLQARIDACVAAGIDRSRLLVDPGFGFGKTLTHNLTLMHHLQAFVALGAPLLVGVSRKSMIGAILDRPVEERLYGSVALAVMAVEAGASVIRVHDVEATRDAIQVTRAVLGAA